MEAAYLHRHLKLYLCVCKKFKNNKKFHLKKILFVFFAL